MMAALGMRVDVGMGMGGTVGLGVRGGPCRVVHPGRRCVVRRGRGGDVCVHVNAVAGEGGASARVAALDEVSSSGSDGAGRQKVKLTGLTARDFRHPLDESNTRLLQSLPGMDMALKALVGSTAEEAMYMENVGTSVLVSETQLPALHALLVEAAEILELGILPELYLRQSAAPNAYTMAVQGKKPFVVLTTGLVELLEPEEVQCVIAHELGHLKCEHGLWLTAANLIVSGLTRGNGPLGALLAPSLEGQLLRWVRAAELTCDRAALLVAQDSGLTVVSTLMKLAGGSKGGIKMFGEMNAEAFLGQARRYKAASEASALGWFLFNAQTQQLSHPLPVLRAQEIDAWAHTDPYKNLLAKGTRRRPPPV